MLRRLFSEEGEAFRAFDDFRDETLSQPLTNALARLANCGGLARRPTPFP